MTNTAICTLLSICFFFITDVKIFAVAIWIFLFFGSSIVPCIAGSIISSLPVELKGSGYSLQNIIVNIFGYSPAAYVYGSLYEYTKNIYPTLSFSVCLGFSFFGLLLIICVIEIKKQQV